MLATRTIISTPLWLGSLLLLGSCCPRVTCCPAPVGEQPAAAVTPVHPQDDVTERSIRIPSPVVEWMVADQGVRTNPCDVAPPPAAAVLALTGGDSHEHEVHDCQRLIVRSGTADRFGPLVAVYPLDQAMALERRVDFAEWTPVANIYSWGTIDGSAAGYDTLGVSGGWNCLWLRNLDGRWSAAVDNLGCFQPDSGTRMVRFAPGAAAALQVRESRHPNPMAEYPRTARWGWSPTGVHYVGIKCGTAWCGVTPLGVDPNEGAVLVGPEHRSIPGWYDEQHLGVPIAGDTLLRPGPVGRIYPSDLHFALRTTPAWLDHLFDTGFSAANIEIAEPVGTYGDKFNLRSTGGVGRADVWLRLGTPRGVQFRNGAGPHQDGQLTVAPHAQHAAQGSVRWRWHDTDETAWVSCRSGCCDVMPT